MKPILFICALVFIIISKPAQAAENESYKYITAVIDSLQISAVARDRFQHTKNLDMIGAIKTLRTELKTARAYIEPYEYSNNEYIKHNADDYISIYETLIITYDEMLQQFEDSHNNPDTENNLGTFQRNFSEELSTADTRWRKLPLITIGTSCAVIDVDRKHEGKIKYLTITKQQRETLLKKLESAFGDEVKQELQGGGVHPIETSAQMLWEFFNKPLIPSDG